MSSALAGSVARGVNRPGRRVGQRSVATCQVASEFCAWSAASLQTASRSLPAAARTFPVLHSGCQALYIERMEPKPSSAVALAVQALRLSHPGVPLQDVLDLVMQSRTGSVADIADLDLPVSELGQVVAACFDRGMTPEEWRGLSVRIDHRAVAQALKVVWRDEVLARFAKRYGLTMADGQPPQVTEVKVRYRSLRAF